MNTRCYLAVRYFNILYHLTMPIKRAKAPGTSHSGSAKRDRVLFTFVKILKLHGGASTFDRGHQCGEQVSDICRWFNQSWCAVSTIMKSSEEVCEMARSSTLIKVRVCACHHLSNAKHMLAHARPFILLKEGYWRV